MILFAGSEERGYFLEEPAKTKKMKVEYLGNAISIETQLTAILEKTMQYLVIDIEQYIDKADELATKIESIKRAKNCNVIIYAPGYVRESRIIQELNFRGIRFYIFAVGQADAKEEFERCLNGYYLQMDDPLEEEDREAAQKDMTGKRIGITGVCRRIGTTTEAVQLVKYLQVKGYKACYIEVNNTGFVQEHGQVFVSEHDEYLGRVTYEGVDLYYKQEKIQEIFHQDYDYFVFDYGAYSEQGFNKTSFLEKDIRIFVAGSKATEMKYTQQVLQNEYYRDVFYLFNFISEKERPELLEYMEEKAEITYFTVYAPDQFEYIHNPEFDRLIPVENKNPELPKKKGFFRRKQKQGVV